MRCMACGAEMVLMNVVQDDTMAVPGFEHQTFMCSECQDVERRLVFTKQNRESDTEPMLEQAAPPVAPASTVQGEPVAASGLLSCPVEPDQTVSTVPAEPTEPVQPTQTASLAPVQTAPEEPRTTRLSASKGMLGEKHSSRSFTISWSGQRQRERPRTNSRATCS
jgi:hypothetical protein